MDQVKILIIVPAFNEQGNIKQCVDRIFSLKRSVDVLVINDGSKDSTVKEALKTKAFVVSHPFNLGIGGAVQTGFKFARDREYDVVVQFDGDGQHDVDYLEDLLKPILNKQADMAIGSRFLPPFLGYQSSFLRRIGINFFAYLISWLTQSKVTDPTSGFRAFNKKLIDVFARYYPHDFPEPEAIMVARRHHARVVEVPVKMNERLHGASSIRYLKTLYYMVKVTFAIGLDLLKTRKV